MAKMDGKDVSVIAQTSSSLTRSGAEDVQVLDSIETKVVKYQACPICRSEVRFFFVNFHEKLLMCENTECDFPFGYEDLQFVTMTSEDEIKAELSDIINKRSLATITPTCTISEVDERSTVCDSELKSQFEIISIDTKIDKEKDKKQLEEDLVIAKKVQDIVKIDKQKKKSANRTLIKDEKMIENLRKMQESSGIQLLEPSEMELIPKPKQEPQDVKISIRNDTGNMISIDLTITADSTG